MRTIPGDADTSHPDDSNNAASYILGRNTSNNNTKVSSIGTDNKLSISDLQFTSGNVIGYSGWTNRGLQLSSKNNVSMNYVRANAVEINVNTVNWASRNKLFVLGLLGEDGSEYIMQGYHWGYINAYIYSVNDTSTSIAGVQLTNQGAISDNDDNFHSLTLVFSEGSISTYLDGTLAKSNSMSSISNIVGIKLYNDSTLYSDSPYESLIFYNDLTASDVAENYNRFVKRINTTGYENAPIETATVFNTVADLIKANLEVSSVVTTRGYYSAGDNGSAKYKIVSFDTFYSELPEDCRTVTINNEIKATVDGYGNHVLRNGLVAKIISDTNTFTPEQYGAKGDGITSDTEAFICLFALTKTGTINFRSGATYMIASRSAEECSQYVDNRYLKAMIGTFTGGCHRPLIANCNNLVLNGNWATMKIPDDDFGFGMGMLNLGGTIEGLEITNIILDSNGLTMSSSTNKASNHTIVYSPTENSVLNNLNIHHNKFLANGTVMNMSDAGGDHILIINPCSSHDVYIEDNEFYDWGRWVYSVDLGGNGERFYNYKFNRNKCVQSEKNIMSTGKYRGLGWIDFEARKCWTNLEVCNNTVEGLVGFAMNGNGKTLENFTFNNNTVTFIERDCRSAYPYFISFYSVRDVKNFVCEGNILDEPYSIVPSRYAVDGASIRNNSLGKALIFLHGIYGDIVIDSNGRTDGGDIVMVDNHMYLPSYLKEDAVLSSNFVFTNNTGGIISNGEYGNVALFCNVEDYVKYNYINFTIKNNQMSSMSISVFGHPQVEFDPSQITGTVFSVKGAKYTAPTKYAAVNTPVMGGAMYEVGDLMVENATLTRLDSPFIPSFYASVVPLNRACNIYCSQAGYFPQIYSDTQLALNQKITAGKFYFTENNLYIALNGDVTTPAEGNLPSHTDGMETWGDVKLLWLASIGRIRVEEV